MDRQIRGVAHLDHFVVAARTLEEGAGWVTAQLGGVPLAGGGAHPRMGTHNRFLRLGGVTYLEMIAIDPAAPPPSRPRWFGLDDAATQARLAERPRVVGWVAAVPDIAAAACPIDLGPAEAMTRGALAWMITIPKDGMPPEGGTMPALIAWPPGQPHHALGLPDLGCALAALDLGHPAPSRLQGALDAVGLDPAGILVRHAPAYSLAVSIRTPTATVTLQS